MAPRPGTPNPNTGVMPDDVMPLWQSWRRRLASEGKSPNTIASYRLALQSFSEWCVTEGRPTCPEKQAPDDVAEFMTYLLATRSAGTAGTRFRSLRAWFRWLVDEGELDVSPMARLKAARADVTPPAVLSDAQLTALLATCDKAKDFIGRRDHALLRILIDTGIRRGELAALEMDDVDLEAQVLVVRKSKTKRGRLVPIATKATEALDRYVRARKGHRWASSPKLWLGLHGPLTGEGIRQTIGKRAREAGVDDVFVHQFRHTFAHQWLSGGGQEHDAAAIAGWSGTTMIARYGASAAAERARDAHKRLSPGDRL